MRFLFVHGSCHGAWCWRDVLPFFNMATAIDLPRSPPAQVTLDHYARAICGQLTEPTILVGHSAGGFAITAAAEQAPHLVRGLIHVCAYVPVSGQSLAQMRRAGPSQPLAGALRLSADRAAFDFDPARVSDILYHDCPPDRIAFARQHLSPEPVAPQETALTLHHAPHLPRAYVACETDRAIPPAYQITMAGRMPRRDLPSGHSPFFAMPDRLADALHHLAAAM